MSSSQPLVRCPECNCQVRSNRLEGHRERAHVKRGEPAVSSNPRRKINKPSTPLTSEVFRRIESSVDFWVRRKQYHLYNPNNVNILIIMTLEEAMGYSFAEINKYFGNKVLKDKYKVGAQRLKTIFKQMMEQRHLTPHRYDTCTNQTTSNCYDSKQSDEENSGDVADWYECNTVDRMDGSKYIGYHRREYESNRFGSFPIHDDYSDESWADDNPWE